MADNKKKRCGWIVIVAELALLVIVALVLWWILSSRNDGEEEGKSHRSKRTDEQSDDERFDDEQSDDEQLNGVWSRIYDRLKGNETQAVQSSSAVAQSSSAVPSSAAEQSSAVAQSSSAHSSAAEQSSSAAYSSSAAQTSSAAQSSGTEARLAMDACERFLKDEETALVLPVEDCYNTNDQSAGTQELYFSEMIALYQDAANSAFSSEKETPLDAVEYTYIDVNLDGKEELLLRFTGMNIYAPDDDSLYEVVLSYEDGELCQLYRGAGWARSYLDISYEGLIFSGGSGGADVFSSDLSLLLDGECHELYSETGYRGLESFCSTLTWRMGDDVVSERLRELAAEDPKYGDEDTIYYECEVLMDDEHYYYALGDSETPLDMERVIEIFNEFAIPWLEPDEGLEIMKRNFFRLAGEQESAGTLWEYISGEREVQYPKWQTYSLMGVLQE